MSDDSIDEFIKEQFSYLDDEAVERWNEEPEDTLQNPPEIQGLDSVGEIMIAITTVEYGINEMVNQQFSSSSLSQLFRSGVSYHLFVNAKIYLLLHLLKEDVNGLSIEMPRRLEQINGLDTDVVLTLYNRVVYNDRFRYISRRIGKSLAKAFPDWITMKENKVIPLVGQMLKSRAEGFNMAFNAVIQSHMGNLRSISKERKLF